MNEARTGKVLYAFIGIVAVVAIPGLAHAQTAPGALAQQQIDQVLSAYQTAANGWSSSLLNDAKALFYLVATIQFVWGAAQLLLANSDMGSWITFLIRQCFTIGLCYGILENATSWGGDVVNGLRQAGGQAGVSATTSPGDIVILGFNFMVSVYQGVKFGGTAQLASDLALIAAGIITVVVFSLIAARMALILVESYFALNAGLLLLGLLPAPWSQSYAMNAIRWIIATGLKLFVMELVVGVGETIMSGFVTTDGTQSGSSAFVILASAVMLLALVQELPSYAAALATGGHGSQGSGLLAAAAAIGGGIGGAVGASMSAGASATGAGMAANAAWDAAGGGGSGGAGGGGGSGGGDGSGGAGTPSSGGFGSRVAGASKILGQQVIKDFGAKLSGAPGANSGTMGGRIAMRIKGSDPDESSKPRLPPEP